MQEILNLHTVVIRLGGSVGYIYVRPTGDQEVAGSIPTGSGKTFFSGD